jgi:hypothetical protein
MPNEEPDDWRGAWMREDEERGRENARELAGEAMRLSLKWLIGAVVVLAIILVVVALVGGKG